MRRPKIFKSPEGVIFVERFNVFRRLEHLAVILVFVTLVLSGFPQKFYEAFWATPLLNLFGGLDSARQVHRIAGVVFSLMSGAHIVGLVYGLLAKKMSLALLPTPQDLRDAWNNLSYYLRLRRRPPSFPKFDYSQKFEYVGIMLGGLVMVVSGLVLMYPMLVASFLPGQLFAAARELHSNEALLALLVLVVWHVYGAHLSPEIFPLDKTIFTGYMSLHDLEHRHALEYKRLFPDGPPKIDEPMPKKSAETEAPETKSDERDVPSGGQIVET